MVTLDAPVGLVYTESNVTLFFGDRSRGSGTLYISKSSILWKGPCENDTLTLEYPSISLHAISRDKSMFPHECLYLLLESPESISEEERELDAEVTEIRFVPQSENSIKALYNAVIECLEFHPDPEDVDSEEVEEDMSNMLMQGKFYTADNMPDNLQFSEEGQAVLERLQINTTNDQFEDADGDM